MKRMMLLALAAAAVAALVAWPALAGRSNAGARAACHAKAVDVYFWPHGHPAVPSLRFGKFPPPHLEVYRRGSLVNSGFLGFVMPTSYTFAKSCKTVGDAAAKWGGGPVRQTKATRRIRCGFPTAVELREAALANGQQLVLTLGHTSKIVLYVELHTKGSYADYDGRYCRAAPVPGVK